MSAANPVISQLSNLSPIMSVVVSVVEREWIYGCFSYDRLGWLGVRCGGGGMVV